MNFIGNRTKIGLQRKKGTRFKNSPRASYFLLCLFLVLLMGVLFFLSENLAKDTKESQTSINVELEKMSVKVPESDEHRNGSTNTQQDKGKKPKLILHDEETNGGSTPQEDKGKKPKLILHVGPRKTATTTIQLSVLSLGKNEYSPYLKEDDYEIVNSNWSDVINIIEQCFLQLPENCTTTEWDRMVDELDQIHERGKHAIITNEALSVVPKTPEVKEMFNSLEEKWDVTVIMVYRPYETWLPSIYRELRAQGMISMRSKAWRSFTYHLAYDVSFVEFFSRSWMKNSDLANDLHQKDVETELVGRGEIKGLQLGDPLETKELYDYIFGNSKVKSFDLIESGEMKRDIVERFTCEGLQAANTCTFIKNRRRAPKRRRRGLIYDFEEDLIVMAAFRRQIIKQTKLARWGVIGCSRVERDPARMKLKTFMKENNMTVDDFPKECVSDENTQKIKERSWKMENMLSSKPRTKEQFDLDFERERINFCTVDVEKVLQMETLNNFLGSRQFTRHCADEELTAKKCHYFSSLENDPDVKIHAYAKDECTDAYLQALMRKYPKNG